MKSKNLIILFLYTFFLLYSCKEENEKPVEENLPPVVSVAANPANLVVDVGAAITLDASASKDPENKTLTFKWEIISQPTGSSVTLSNSTSANISFQPTHAGQYKLKLTCNDGEKTTSKDVTVTVNTPAVTFPQTISADINSDVIWENINPTAGEPDYIVSKSINVNAKLTIKPGVVVHMAADSDILVNPQGNIIAKGANTDHIVFTRPGAAAPAWNGIAISSASEENEFDFVEIHFAGKSFLRSLSNKFASLGLDGGNLAKLKIKNTIINKGGGYGIYVEDNASLLNVDKVEIKDQKGTSIALPLNQLGNLAVTNKFTGNNGYNAVEVLGSEIANQAEMIWAGFEDATSYYISGDLIIRSGLKIDPGVSIEFAADRVLRVEGGDAYISAKGLADKYIVFKGKTNSLGFWNGISISSQNVKNEFDYVKISNAGSTFLPNLTNLSASLGIDGDNLSKVSITNSIISNGKGYGLYVENGSVITQFAKNEIKDINGTPLALSANEVGKLDAASKFSSENTINAVEIFKSTLNQPQEVIWKSFADGTKYYVSGDLEVRSALRIEAGAIFEFNALRNFIIHRDNNSYIIAKGTATKKIVFTGKNKTKGYWNGIAIISNLSENEFDHVEISYGGGGFLTGLVNTSANLGMDGDNLAKLKLTNSAITNSGGWGFVYENGAVINNDFKTSNTFTGNTSGGYKVP